MVLTPEVAKIAADWWANFLKAPTVQNNGEISQSSFATFVAAKVYKPRTPEQIEKFRDYLAQHLIWSAQEHPNLPRLYVGVDYHACPELHTAAIDAEIPGYDDMLTFPCKTGMWISRTHIEVAVGYRAAPEVIWGEKPASAY